VRRLELLVETDNARVDAQTRPAEIHTRVTCIRV
jgi:hypothetical protein